MIDGSPGWAFAGLERLRTRRLSDKITIAFHAACDEGALDIAGQLLGILTIVVTRPLVLPAKIERRQPVNLAAFHERLWNLRYPSPWNTNAGWDLR